MSDEPRQRGAAFFDLDRTIIAGSSVFVLGWAAYRAGLVSNQELFADARNAVSFLFAGASDEKTDAVKSRVLQAIEGVPVETLAELSEQIIPRLESDVRREARGLIDLHHAADRDTYIVSASPIEIVGEFAEAIGLTGGIGTVAAIEDGIYSGDLAEPFCYGEGKAIAIEKIAEEKGYDLRLSYAYTDSAGDLPMLEAVGHPVAVNPDRALETIAYHRGWPIVEFSRTKKRVIKRTTAAVGAAGLAGAAFAVGIGTGKRAAARRSLVQRVLN
ncbi:MAG: HAD family hydrolase [Actinomycetota bacterium]